MAAAALGMALGGPLPAQVPRYVFTGQEDHALLAAGFRRLATLAEDQVGGDFPPATRCLALGDYRERSDPPPPVLNLLRDSLAEIELGSRCSVDRTLRTSRSVTVTATGGRAMFLWIQSVRLDSPDRAVLDLGVYVGRLSAADWLCEARRSPSGWVIGACRMTRVS